MTAEIDREIADIDSVLGVGPSPSVADLPPLQTFAPPPSFNTATIVNTVENLLDTGQVATTQRVHEVMAQAGVPLPADANYRITKALSRTGRYVGGRTKGWQRKNAMRPAGSLKDESQFRAA